MGVIAHHSIVHWEVKVLPCKEWRRDEQFGTPNFESNRYGVHNATAYN